MRRVLVTGYTVRRYEHLATFPETIEQELRPAVCEHRQTDLRRIIRPPDWATKWPMVGYTGYDGRIGFQYGPNIEACGQLRGEFWVVIFRQIEIIHCEEKTQLPLGMVCPMSQVYSLNWSRLLQ